MARTRKAAPSDQTNAKIAAEQIKADQRTDAAPLAAPTAASMIRNALAERTFRPTERMLSDDDRIEILLKRSQDAARLELRGDQWDAEDRKDAASDALIRVLAACEPMSAAPSAAPRRCDRGRPADVLAWIDRAESLAAPRSVVIVPVPSDKRATLKAFCGHVGHWRDARVSDRNRDHAEYVVTAAERGQDGFTAAERESIERGRINANHDAETAAIQAAKIARRLDVPTDGPTADTLYQWLRDADAETCAAERGYTYGSWRVRVSTGGKLLRVAVPSALALLDSLLPDSAEIIVSDAHGLTYSLDDRSREAGSRSRMLSDVSGVVVGRRSVITDGVPSTEPMESVTLAHWREGTNGGDKPTRAIDKHAADLLCEVRHVAAAPKRAEQNRADQRRDRKVAVSNGRDARRMIQVGVSDDQRRATALRSLAVSSAQGRRERGVQTAENRRTAQSRKAA